MLIARTKQAWIVAAHRFVEVAVGIAVGLALTAVWPGDEPTASIAPPACPFEVKTPIDLFRRRFPFVVSFGLRHCSWHQIAQWLTLLLVELGMRE